MASLTVAPSLMVMSLSAGQVGVSSVFSSKTSLRMESSRPLAGPMRSSRVVRIVAMATPQGAQKSAIEQAIADAEEVCSADELSPGCANAWDDVEELAAHASHQKTANQDKKDPLEQFCIDSPEADECRVYED